MKKIITFIAALMISLNPLISNPIPPAGLIVEIYFEDGEWVLVVDNYYMMSCGMETFEDVALMCQNGFSYILPDVVPDPDEWYTLLTAADLELPFDIDPVEDFVDVWDSQGYSYAFLEWAPGPNTMVSGPAPDQSIIIKCVSSTPDYWYLFWPLKSGMHNCFSIGCSARGTFTGFVYDQDGNPVPDAEIFYLPESLLYSDYFFYHIVTNDWGEYINDYMPAKNYYIEKIVVDSVDYIIDEYITIEPNETTTMDFTIYTTHTDELNPILSSSISNYPNPFKQSTTFSINLGKINPTEIYYIEIMNMEGQTVEIIEADATNKPQLSQSIYWNTKGNLEPGQYLACLKSGDQLFSTCKIAIQ
jgi:hypothetical protein